MCERQTFETPNFLTALSMASSSVSPQTQQSSSLSNFLWSPFILTKYAGIRCPHQSCLEMHHGRIFSSQWNQVFSCCCGMIFRLPLRTTSHDLRAISSQSTYLNFCFWRETAVNGQRNRAWVDSIIRNTNIFLY